MAKTPDNPVIRALRAVNDLLARVGHLIGKVVNPVVVGVIYLLVLGPVAIARRISGVDPLQLKKSGAAGDSAFRNVQFGNNTIDACRRQF